MRLRMVLKGRFFVDADPDGQNASIVERPCQGYEKGYVSLPKCFRDGDRVKVTVELIERREAGNENGL